MNRINELIDGFTFAEDIGAGGVFELNLGDSEIPLTTKREREQKLFEEKLKKKEKMHFNELIKLFQNAIYIPQDY
ncbi:hypothetical protein [Prochlorococcus sp. MIT 0801]|uniref:hypothetical protein n=1 Tax=Prochlorococcus sp. MIT 0801 TaxID=1501269 RepID=UPI0004F6188C|nr:hypothetical protein [Prochlorococcus sp. MIT 0801]AIQ96175.1 hypothetical protein EW15_0083 [Prochlorococcus sp. MIT 0801]